MKRVTIVFYDTTFINNVRLYISIVKNSKISNLYETWRLDWL